MRLRILAAGRNLRGRDGGPPAWTDPFVRPGDEEAAREVEEEVRRGGGKVEEALRQPGKKPSR